uniref:Reverse transcriptase domain-containing protein n=1 Tax=Tanacetum cinerariifolium TaxID=118510 RepID=A0A6L2M6E0_TANCI|nr:reverse transcriptase domain-containing protein [Tanacetum cinerariifolium]
MIEDPRKHTLRHKNALNPLFRKHKHDYTTASSGNASPDPPDNLSKYLFASLAISPFHNVQAYNATNKPPIPPQDLITPPTILTPSLKKLSLTDLTPTRMTLELASRSIAYPTGIAEDVFVQVGKLTFLANFIVVEYDVDPHVPLILGRPFLRTTRALVDVNGEELILRDGDKNLIFHADNTSKHPHKHENKSINMINFIDITCEDHFPEVLKFKKSNHPLSGSTTFLSDSLPSLTPFETSDSLLEEFVNELALLHLFPLRNEDDSFDPEADLRKIKYFLKQDPSIESDIDIIDPVLESFTDKPTLDYSPPPGDDDDDIFYFKSNNDECKKLLYGDCYKDIEYEKDKNKESKMKLLVVEAHIVESDVFLTQLLTSDSTLPEESSESSEIASLSSFPFRNKDNVFNPGILILELPFHLKLPVLETLLSFSFKNEDKVFNPGILTSKGVHSLTLELSHRTYETFKIINIHLNIFNEGPMKIFPFFCVWPKDKGIQGTGYSDKGQKTSQNRQNRARTLVKILDKVLHILTTIVVTGVELAEYINTLSWNRPAFYNYDDDDEDYTIAITSVLSTEEPVDSLIIEDEHLDTILATESDEVIKSSVEDLVPIPSESKGIPDNMCDVPFRDKSPLLDILKDQFKDFSDSNDDSTLIDDDSFSIDDIDYVEASHPHSELISLEEVKDFHPKDGELEDDVLCEKLLNIHLLIAKIEYLNDNPTLDRVLKSPSSFPIPIEDSDSFFEKSNTSLSYSDNSLPKFETFSDHTEKMSSGNILGEPRVHVPNVLPTHPTLYLDSNFTPSDNSLPESEIFCFNVEEKNSGSTTIHADISLPGLKCFYFRSEPDPGDLTYIIDLEIHENVSFTTNVNPFEEDHSPLLAYVVWIFLPFLTYPVDPPYLLSFRNEDTIFDPGISIYHSFMPGASHQSGTFMKFNVYPNHLNESPMEILSSTCSPMDQ